MPQWLAAMAIGGAGGTLPTLSKIAATFATNPGTPLPQAGLILAILIFFLIGGIIAVCFNEDGTKKSSLALGIAAPAIITGIISGADQSNLTRPEKPAPISDNLEHSFLLAPFTPAIAAEGTVVWPNRYDLVGNQRIDIYVKNKSESGSMPPINVIFQSKSGSLLEEKYIISPQDNHVSIIQPSEANAMMVKVENYITSVTLPNIPYDNISYDFTVETARGSDFLWGLGFSRSVFAIVNANLLKTELNYAERNISSIRKDFAFGLDISHHQRIVNWNILQDQSIDFVFIRATYGTRFDKKYESFWEYGSKSSLKIGFYHYFRNGQSGEQQAKYFINAIRKLGPNYKNIMISVSLAPNQFDDPIEDNKDIDSYIQEFKSFSNSIEGEFGRKPIVNIDPSFFEFIGGKNFLLPYSIWLKDFKSSDINTFWQKNPPVIWQFAVNQTAGIDSVVSQDIARRELLE